MTEQRSLTVCELLLHINVLTNKMANPSLITKQDTLYAAFLGYKSYIFLSQFVSTLALTHLSKKAGSITFLTNKIHDLPLEVHA